MQSILGSGLDGIVLCAQQPAVDAVRTWGRSLG
jgi:hypothetical protein